MKHKLRTLYFIGIGGSGMSGIAEVLLNLGYRVAGSDLSKSETTMRLEKLGARIHYGHIADNLGEVDAVVVSSAVPADNPERREAKRRGIPIVSRATMLGELMRTRQSIAVAGTHGKTTSTSLIAAILAEAGLDPTYVIGGVLNASASHAKLGSGEYIVVEADESDASFLSLYPVVAMVTNIDRDHLENYQQDFVALKKAFIEFLTHLPFYGAAVLCIDDEPIREIMPFISRPVITYGVHELAQYRATAIESHGRQMHYKLHRKGKADLVVMLNHPGRHSVINSLGAFAVAGELGIEDSAVLKALAEFKGVGRRCEELGYLPTKDGGKALVIEDYGHHPTEVSATINAVTASYPQNRVWLAFQPHRYSRTRDCFDDFVECLAKEPRLILTEVYPAGEAPVPSATGEALMKAINADNKSQAIRHFVPDMEVLIPTMLDHAKDGDVFLMMGAGSIGTTMRRYLQNLK